MSDLHTKGVRLMARRGASLTVEETRIGDGGVQLWAHVPRPDDAATGRDPEQSGVVLELPEVLALLDTLAKRVGPLAVRAAVDAAATARQEPNP